MLPIVLFCLFPFFCSAVFLNYYKLLRDIEEDINKPCTIQGHSYINILDRFELNYRLRDLGKGNGCYYRSYIQLPSGNRVFYPEFLPLTIDKIKYTVNAPRTFKYTHELLKQLPSHYEPSIFSKLLFSKPSAFREPEKTIPFNPYVSKKPIITKAKYFQYSKDFSLPILFIVLGLFFEFINRRNRLNTRNLNPFRIIRPCISTIKQKLCHYFRKLRLFFVNLKLSLLNRFRRKSFKKTNISRRQLRNLKPLTFTGKSSEVEVFLKQLDLIFKSNPEKFYNSSKKVIYAMFHLSPNVFRFVNNYIEQKTRLKNCKYGEFVRILKLFYGTSITTECLRDQLALIYLCQHQDVSGFCRQIIDLCLKFSLPQPDICKILVEKLSDEFGGDLGDDIRLTTNLEELFLKVVEFSKCHPGFQRDYYSECSCQLNQSQEYTPPTTQQSPRYTYYEY